MVANMKAMRAGKQVVITAGLMLGMSAAIEAQTLTPIQIRRIDSVFARFDGTNRPGCAVGVDFSRRFGVEAIHGVRGWSVGAGR